MKIETIIKEAKEFNPSVPKVGLYKGVSNEVYRSAKAISRSDLGIIDRSISHYLNGDHKKTKSLTLGDALHCVLFEPEEFYKRFVYCIKDSSEFVQLKVVNMKTLRLKKTRVEVICGTLAKNTKEGKANNELFAETLEKKSVLKTNDIIALNSMAKQIFNNKNMLEKFKNSFFEIVAIWICADTGLKKKAKFDIIHTEEDGTYTLCDLKTARDASLNEFTRDQNNKWEGFVQAGMYFEGLSHFIPRGFLNEEFKLLACENTAPFEGAVRYYDEAAIELGMNIARDRILKFSEFLSNSEGGNYWKGYPQKDEPILVPDYVFRKYNLDLNFKNPQEMKKQDDLKEGHRENSFLDLYNKKKNEEAV